MKSQRSQSYLSTIRPSKTLKKSVKQTTDNDDEGGLSYETHRKLNRKAYMIMYGGDSLNSSAGEISKLYESADQISESVQSFFADEEERKQKHGVKMIAFRNLGKTIRKKFHDSNSNLSHDDNKRGRRLSV